MVHMIGDDWRHDFFADHLWRAFDNPWSDRNSPDDRTILILRDIEADLGLHRFTALSARNVDFVHLVPRHLPGAGGARSEDQRTAHCSGSTGRSNIELLEPPASNAAPFTGPNVHNVARKRPVVHMPKTPRRGRSQSFYPAGLCPVNSAEVPVEYVQRCSHLADRLCAVYTRERQTV